MKAYRFERRARQPAGWVALGLSLALWLALGLVSAHPLLLVVFALPPALMAWDLWRNALGLLTLDRSALRFDSGRQSREIPLPEIARVRLLRRLDFSWVVQVILQDGRKVRVPPNCTPPAEELEAELRAREVPVERVLFSLTG